MNDRREYYRRRRVRQRDEINSRRKESRNRAKEEMAKSTKSDVVLISQNEKMETGEEYILPTTSDGQENVVEPWKLFTLKIKKEPEDVTTSVSVAEQSIFTIEPSNSPISKAPLTVESLFTAEQDDQASEIQNMLTVDFVESSNSEQSCHSKDMVSPKVEPLSSDEETLSAVSETVLSTEISSMDSPGLVKVKEEPIEEPIEDLLSPSMEPVELPLDDITPNLQEFPDAFQNTVVHQSEPSDENFDFNDSQMAVRETYESCEMMPDESQLMVLELPIIELNGNYYVNELTVERALSQPVSDEYTSSSSTLTRPKIDLRERKHVCVKCGKGFLRRNSLNRHIKIHTGEKPFKCEICSKTFAAKYDLGRHITSIHDKIKAFTCDRCEQKFARAENLAYHYKSQKCQKTVMNVVKT